MHWLPEIKERVGRGKRGRGGVVVVQDRHRGKSSFSRLLNVKTQYLKASIFGDTFVQCIFCNMSCVLEK